jgi:lipopolysaccharide heptosyltransferase II
LNAKSSIYIRPQDEEYITQILKENNISEHEKFAVISPGARSHIKRWPADKFVELISLIAKELKLKVILVGDKGDSPVTKYITEHSKHPVIDLSGKTTILELTALLKRAKILISNDSGVLHLASYINTPVVAVFGPTDETKYGPWSSNSAIVKKEIFCRPCKNAQCKFNSSECMHLVKAQDLMRAITDILAEHRVSLPVRQAGSTEHRVVFKRILIVRTDRIGDVLLSTPVIKALRQNYPDAYIAMMVSPYAKDIVEANPYLDQAIIYDKDAKHKSWSRSIKFSQRLKKKKFDLAVILHPTNRVHLVTFFAAIPRRIGYNKKLGFLLSDRIKHTKHLGHKHELEYNLDLIRYLGIEPQDLNLFMPIRAESEKWVDDLFKQEGIKEKDLLLTIHPGASCPSKIWPNERFAEVADKLIEKYGFKALIVAGPKDITLAKSLIKHMHRAAVDLSGRTSVSQLASLLKRSRLFVSNDSGPVHIASSVGVPVISIFGRNQKGLSPDRWGPVGRKDKILHKEVGCIECFAHNCIKEFACLKAITTDDVIKAATAIMEE